MNRGDLYWARLDPTVGAELQKTRPVVVLTINAFNRARKTVIVVPLSSSARNEPPLNVALTGGSVARCDQLRTLDKSRLTRRIGTLAAADLLAIEDGVRKVLGL
ncbi:MAG: type II toxin-antitoxin system PemK/MazF family toxin [Rhodoferax sp.]|uniref:type II toxin-antitoxin system PemK/MazF family toxin n=1 Tax=Rhodoferax sp. TaxID=50421 RepID=UPI002605E1D1|nr:type II toxin-antitoxin system PemK/MazF family toxin [Rhodoferax sp.]MDD5333033.1 type II toxin-antitoxin system PemK/MazF family toxin [Rhodoferax sp.]